MLEMEWTQEALRLCLRQLPVRLGRRHLEDSNNHLQAPLETATAAINKGLVVAAVVAKRDLAVSSLREHVEMATIVSFLTKRRVAVGTAINRSKAVLHLVDSRLDPSRIFLLLANNSHSNQHRSVAPPRLRLASSNQRHSECRQIHLDSSSPLRLEILPTM